MAGTGGLSSDRDYWRWGTNWKRWKRTVEVYKCIATFEQNGSCTKHLEEFQKIDPNLTADDVAKILEYVRKNVQPTPTNFGGKAFEAAVNIGGKSVKVKVDESAGGVIKTGYPVPLRVISRRIP